MDAADGFLAHSGMYVNLLWSSAREKERRVAARQSREMAAKLRAGRFLSALATHLTDECEPKDSNMYVML